MLLLRRRSGQSIIIGQQAEIIVKVIREENGIITLGVEAPKSTLVDREEVYRKREAEEQSFSLFEEGKALEEPDYVSA